MKGPPSPIGVVIVAHGPTGVTKAAIKRARQLGPASLALVDGGGGDVSRFASRVDLVAASSGPEGICEAIEGLATDGVVLVHDDATVGSDLVAMAPGLRDVAAPATPEGRPGGCVVGPSAAVARVFEVHGARGWNPPDAVATTTTVRHDGRCAPAAGPQVAACLIVRDEESMLGDCLASLQGIVDEIVVCDTGSIDATIDVARSHGASVTTCDWRNDFAAARNRALAAVGPSDWIIWLDADERLACEDPEGFLSELASSDAEVLAIRVVSSRRDAPDSAGLIGRIFRPHLRFEGALHEQLVRADGSPPRIASLLRGHIEHLGYDAAMVDVAAKAERNLTVAQRAYDRSTTPKTALDYARSMALVDRDPADVLAVLDVALDRASDTDPVRTAALAMAAGVALGMGDTERALAYAEATLALEPGNDVAALVLARCHPDRLGTVDHIVAFARASTPTLSVAENRAEALLRGARSAADLGRFEVAAELFTAAAEVAIPESVVANLGVLFDDLAEPASAELLVHLSDGGLALAGVLLGDPLGDVLGPASPSAPTGVHRGIGLPPDIGRVPCAPAMLAGMVHHGSRVLDFSGDPTLGALVDARAEQLVRFAPDEALVANLESLAERGERFDFATGPLAHDIGRRIASLVVRLMDPAGRALFWDLNPDGFVVTESVRAMYRHVNRDDTTTAALPEIGFVGAGGAPNGTRLFRPSLDGRDVTSKCPDGATPAGSLIVQSPSPLPEHLQLGYRLAVPGTWTVHFETPPNAASPATTERHFTLVTNDTIFPDPAWIGALIEAARTGSEPAGARLIGTDGRHIHAGLTDDARPIGFGDPGGFPLLSADRTGTRLAPPYVVSGIDAGTREMRGRIVGSALAVGTPVQDPPGPVASFTDVFGETVLFIGGAAPGRGDADWESAITKAAFRLIEAGMTVAYQWDPDELPPDPRHLALWSAAGVVTVPPPDPRLLSDQFLPDAMAPRSDALALALDPVAVVCLSRASVASDFVLIADRAPAAFTAYAGDEELGHLSARLDRCLSVESVADAVLEVRDHPMRVGGEADIPVIAPVAATPGLVSIVIPVYNRWDLTKQCLETIAAHTPEPHEIIIVDNGSTDGTATAAKGAGCLLITNTENLGFPTAVNQGIEAATGEFVCVLNNDTEVTGGWLTALLAALEVPGTAIVGPRSNQIAGLQRVPNAPGMDERGAARRWAAEWTAAAEDRTWQTARLVGFCLLARRETFERVGGFDQGFGIGNYEDDELGNRIQGQGGTLRVADGSVVLHHGSATFKELGLDYASIMHAAARHLGTRTSEVTGVASALILSDASAEKAARAAVSCMYAADRVRIAERSALLSAELAAAAVRGVQVEVINADWTMDQGSKTAIEGLAGSLVVVVGANEQVAADDWGAVRAELESVDGALAAVTPSGPETRVVPPDHDAIELVGTPSVRIARSFRLVPQHTRES